MSSRFGDRNLGANSTDALGKSNLFASKRFGGQSNFLRQEKPLTAEEALEIDKAKALEFFEPYKIPPTFMYVSISGIIKSGNVILQLKSLIPQLTYIDEGLYVRKNEI